jgi:hypothetical protein
MYTAVKYFGRMLKPEPEPVKPVSATEAAPVVPENECM